MTLLMQNGGTIRETMDNIGDSTQEVVMRHYTRTVQEHQRQVVNRMAVGMTSESKTLQHILGVQYAVPTPVPEVRLLDLDAKLSLIIKALQQISVND